MRSTTGKEHDHATAPPDDVETTDEVPIVQPKEGDEQAIASSELGDHIAAEREKRANKTAAVDEAQPAAAAEEDVEAAGAGEDVPRDGPEVSEVDDTHVAEIDDVQVADAEDLQVADDAHVAEVDDVQVTEDRLAPDGASLEAPADEPQDAQWGGLTPLDPDDLAALDPSALEQDLQDEDDAEVVELVEPVDRGPSSERTAADLTASTVLRMSSRPPHTGWRRFIYEMTGGLIRPRLSRSERERVEQLGLIRTLVTQPRRITVLSRKGGVGKTTTTLMLGQLLASERGDRIVAVDGNPDAGSLGYRVAPQRPTRTITDLLNELDTIQRYADIRPFTAQTDGGLEVLASDDDPQITTAMGDQEYEAVLSLLDRFYNLILIDTGTGILDSAVQGILDGTDQIVLVVSPSLDAARVASQTLDWLTEHGFVELVETAVTVINQVGRSSLVDVSRIEEHFWDRCGATVRIPWDRYLEVGAETELSDLSPATRAAYMQLAAAVARRFET